MPATQPRDEGEPMRSGCGPPCRPSIASGRWRARGRSGARTGVPRVPSGDHASGVPYSCDWGLVWSGEGVAVNRRTGGLGRGLGALIPELAPSTGLLEAPIDSIEPNPRQPRGEMDLQALDDLAASIREHGVLQPLVVQRIPPGEPGSAAGYRLIAGERRWRAAKLAGLAAVPVVVKDVDDRGLLELALVENLQRSDLGALEEAAAYRYLVEEVGLTQDEVAKRVGRARVTVSNALRLLEAPVAIQRALAEGEITEGHARALLGTQRGDVQAAILRRVCEQKLSVRQTEELVRRSQQEKRQGEAQVSPEVGQMERDLERALGTRVTIRRGRRGGAVTIHFYDDDELDGLLMKLTSLE